MSASTAQYTLLPLAEAFEAVCAAELPSTFDDCAELWSSLDALKRACARVLVPEPTQHLPMTFGELGIAVDAVHGATKRRCHDFDVRREVFAALTTIKSVLGIDTRLTTDQDKLAALEGCATYKV